MVGEYNFTITQGSDDQNVVIYISDLDLTDYTAGMMIKPSKKTKSKYDHLTTENSRITIVYNAGLEKWVVTLKFPSSVTSNYCWEEGVWDLELYSNDTPPNVIRLLEGKVSINKEVTTQ
jgi:hypothetical protein